MLFSHNLLRSFIQLDDTISNIANQLTLKSCEIEGTTTREISAGVVIGLVTEVKKHPSADKLVICQIDCGSVGTYQICTAAENIAADYYVPVALPDTYLPALDITIGKRMMRGEESNGMICAKEELGINEDTHIHGIRNMQTTTPNNNLTPLNNPCDFTDITSADLGIPLSTKYPRLNDTHYDVDNKTLTHRPDMTGHFGLAQEISAIYHTHFQSKISNYSLPSYHNILKQKTVIPAQARISKAISDNLRTYSLTQLTNITVQPSTFPTRLTLIDLGLTPRNNRVDFSNLFMLITGQPIHCFDADTIDGQITVRQATDGEAFIDLFDKTHTLQSSDIVIADDTKVLALGGIIGGANSGVTEKTKNITIEIGNFDPIIVRRTAARLGLRTDAVSRFEKNINPDYSIAANHLLDHYLDHYVADLGPITTGEKTVYQAHPTQPRTITINQAQINTTIRGNSKQEYFDKITHKILTNLGCDLRPCHSEGNKESLGTCHIDIPLRRGTADLTIPVDLTEEVVRLYGYEKIGKLGLTRPIAQASRNPLLALQHTFEQLVTQTHHCDLIECYPRANKIYYDMFGIDTSTLPQMQNALSPETARLSNSLLYNLLACATKNSKFFDTLRLATTNHTWNQTTEQPAFIIPGPTINPNTAESSQTAILLYQKTKTDRSEDLLFNAKHIINDTLTAYGFAQHQYQITSETHFHPNKQGHILVGPTIVGFIGELHPLILEQCKIDANAQLIYATLNLPTLQQLQAEFNTTEKKQYHTLQDQIITRDLSFVTDKEQHFDTLIHAIQQVQAITHITTFDLYAGDKLPNDKKAIALQITIQGDGSLTTDDINNVMDTAITAAHTTGAILRKDFS